MTRAELKTARLTLRPPMAEDAGWIAQEIARPEVHAMLTAPPRPYSLADAHDWLAAVAQRRGQYVIEAGGPVGVVTVESLTRGPELGYWLRLSAWGHGYMTEAVRAVIGEHFAASDLPLVSGHLTANAGSAAVLRKNGFRYTGVVRRMSGFHGREVDVQRMVLDRADWPGA